MATGFVGILRFVLELLFIFFVLMLSKAHALLIIQLITIFTYNAFTLVVLQVASSHNLRLFHTKISHQNIIRFAPLAETVVQANHSATLARIDAFVIF